jgi:hypothetical protein
MLPALIVGGLVVGGAYLLEKFFNDRGIADNASRIPRAFISFDYDHDLDAKTLLVGQARNAKTPFSIADHSAKSSMPRRKWVDMVRTKMGICDVVIVLVGQTMASARGVHREIEIARELGKPLFGIYVNGAGGRSQLPKGLRRVDVVPWTWDGLADRLRQV